MAGERRLRVWRGSAEDPLNLLQVMLAKGFSTSPSFRGRSRAACVVGRDRREGFSADNESKHMIATKESFQPNNGQLPSNSNSVYVVWQIHPDIRVHFREIDILPMYNFNVLNDGIKLGL